ncbi:MAG: MerR family transcriptional regulator [Paenibacillaceae bacterium]|nr:MerR family transcriptional regulator [Paenibacillaceae bacterium]
MYTIQRVSLLLGIPPVTIRAWEARYRLITPVRTRGGHRLYSDRDVETLRWVKTQIGEKRIKIGEAVRQWKQQWPVGACPATKAAEVPAPDSIEAYVGRLHNDFMELNAPQAHRTIDLALANHHFEEVFHSILVTVLNRIGEGQECGAASEVHEHFAAEVAMQRFSHYLRVLPVYSYMPKALALCPRGEHRHLGLMLFSLFLRARGMDVIYLGPDTPLDDAIPVLGRANITVVAVSVTDPALAAPLEAWIGECLRDYPRLKFALSGDGFHRGAPGPLAPHFVGAGRADWDRWYEASFHCD